MTKEVIFKRKEILDLALSLFTFATIVVACNLNPHTIPALESTVNNRPNNCTTISEGEPYIIAVHGSGRIEINGVAHPDKVMEERLDAAGNEFAPETKYIVILDGVSDPDKEDFNKKYLLAHFPNIPAEIVLTEKLSINTPTNIDRLKELIDPEDKVEIITDRSHLFRALFYACTKGLKATGIAAEDALKINDIQSQNVFENERWWLRIAALIDKSGFWATQYKLLIQGN